MLAHQVNPFTAPLGVARAHRFITSSGRQRCALVVVVAGGMRVRKRKATRRHVRFYRLHSGAFPPYKVLMDGSFAAALVNKRYAAAARRRRPPPPPP